MPRFFIFTKTQWDEPPRLRHQVATLLADAGHEVVFFEKPQYVWKGHGVPRPVGERLTVFGQRHLLHHKLRLTPALHRANACVVKRSVTPALASLGVTSEDVVVNFNFDYFFLRDLFPRNRIVTVINDDFLAIALFGYGTPLRWAMKRTCVRSDRVLTVSVPLQEQLAEFCVPELFQPWADCQYREPSRDTVRNVFLFWGFLNQRIDFPAMLALSDGLAAARPDARILFVGPIQPDHTSHAAMLRTRPNIEVLPESPLDRLPLDRVLAALIPYRAFDPEVDAITLSNKALQLLARGLPLLITERPALPNFMEAPFVVRLDTREVAGQVTRLTALFDEVQPAIRDFVLANGPEARLKQFLAFSG